VVAVRKEKGRPTSPRPISKARRSGVTAPGSSTNFFVMYLMSKAGLKPEDAAYIGVASAVGGRAITEGRLDALSNLDPVMTKLEQDGDIKIVAGQPLRGGDPRIFGGSNPAGRALCQAGFSSTRNPNTMQAAG